MLLSDTSNAFVKIEDWKYLLQRGDDIYSVNLSKSNDAISFQITKNISHYYEQQYLSEDFVKLNKIFIIYDIHEIFNLLTEKIELGIMEFKEEMNFVSLSFSIHCEKKIEYGCIVIELCKQNQELQQLANYNKLLAKNIITNNERLEKLEKEFNQLAVKFDDYKARRPNDVQYYSGKTTSNDWKMYSEYGVYALFVDIIYHHLKLNSEPIFTHSLVGNGHHWICSSTVYTKTNKSCRVFVTTLMPGYEPITSVEILREFANKYNWHIEYIISYTQ